MIKSLISNYGSYIKLVLALVLVAGACYLTYTVTDSRWSAKYLTLEATYSDASAQAQAQARATELDYDLKLAQVKAEGATRVAEADAGATAANNSIISLHKRLNKILADATTETTGTGLTGRTPGETINMLADVLGKSVERNRQLAVFADKSWNAAKQCYDSYNATK